MLTRTFDRRTTDPPFNAQLGSATLPDPEPGPDGTDRVRLTVNLRDDPLGRLHARKQIREDQYQAGRHWQRLYETVEIGPRSVDTTVEPVDGGSWPDPFTERRRKAVLELARLDVVLGHEGSNLVYAVLGRRLFFGEILAMASGSPAGAFQGGRAIKYLGMRFAECLTSLSRALGYSTGRER